MSQLVKATTGSHSEDESIARARRLFNATFLEVPPSQADQWQRDLRTVGSQDIGAVKKLLEEEPGDNSTQNAVLSFICKIDGYNICSNGDSEILRITRKFLDDWVSLDYSLLYLSQKGSLSATSTRRSTGL